MGDSLGLLIIAGKVQKRNQFFFFPLRNWFKSVKGKDSKLLGWGWS